jgi:hypothetical protein
MADKILEIEVPWWSVMRIDVIELWSVLSSKERIRPAEHRRQHIDSPERYTKRTKSSLIHNNDHDWSLPLR